MRLAWRAGGYTILFIALTALFIWLQRPEPPAPAAAAGRVDHPKAARARPRADVQPRTVGEAWRREPFAAKQGVSAGNGMPPPASPLSAAGIRRALRQVELDEQGNVVVDHEALSSLEAAFASLDGKLSAAQLEDLQAVIRAGLPGPAGEQTATIVGNYYRYRRALRDFDPGVVVADGVVATSARYQQLVAMRHRYFGPETAEKLFADEQAHARYTIQSMRIQTTPALSQAEKDRLQAQLKARLPPGVLPEKPIAGWEPRYAAFQREKQTILDAGLTDADKKAQIERLRAEHFSEEELEAARGFFPDLDG